MVATAAAHEDAPMYMIGAMRLPNATLSADDLRFLGSWHRAAAQRSTDPGALVKALYVGLRGHEAFRSVARVCLSRIVPGTHRLQAIASLNGPEVGPNSMAPGYSCFVSPQSSLFALAEGQLRVFSDAQSVLNGFRNRGMPAQRSIRLLSEMGLRGGACIPIEVGSSRGFLFINSSDDGAFDRLPETAYAVLSLSAALAKVALATAFGEGVDPMPSGQQHAAKPFDPAQLPGLVDQRCQDRNGFAFKLAPQGEAAPASLVCHETLAEVIARGVGYVVSEQTREATVAAEQVDEDVVVQVRCADGRISPGTWRSRLAQATARHFGYSLEMVDNGFDVRFSFDAVTEGQSYSV